MGSTTTASIHIFHYGFLIVFYQLSITDTVEKGFLNKLKRGTAEKEKMNHVQNFYNLVLMTALSTLCRNIMIL
jgi:hypothetical protein